jgi:hypothetical protein
LCLLVKAKMTMGMLWALKRILQMIKLYRL